MTFVYTILGVVLLVAVVVDLLWTTLWAERGAGPLTSWLMRQFWQALQRISDQNSRVLRLAGPLILIGGLTMWLILLWAGWTLIFAGAENAILDTREAGPISWVERLYFTGYTIFTLGNGGFAPRDGIWQIATVLATANGMVFITLTVTYLLSVLGAVTQKHSFAMNVTGLGSRGEAVVQAGWDGETFRGLNLPLNTYASQLNTLTANHRAYPVLHYFYSKQEERAPAVAIPVLDEALTIFEYGIVERERPDSAILTNARSSIQNYLNTVTDMAIQPADQTPPPPDLSSIRGAGVRTVDDETFAESVDALAERRRKLLGVVENDARQWPSLEDK